jgi:DeoR family transcriptional regulator, fructose operon transcriptional repressor
MNKPLIPAQRREKIQEYLLVHKIVTNTALSELLDVSEATIRRDLELMEAEGILERTHGGAVLRTGGMVEPEYILRAQSHTDEKRLIGAAAATSIEDGDIIFINSGTTTTQLIRSIRPNAKVTVFTNNLIGTLEMAPFEFELVLIGGSYQQTSNSVAGRFALENLRSVYANKAFIGVDGMHLMYGLTVPTNPEAEVIKLMLERTLGPVSVLADHSKWGKVSTFEIAKIDLIHRIITDEGLNSQARSALYARKIEIEIVSPSNTNRPSNGRTIREEV